MFDYNISTAYVSKNNKYEISTIVCNYIADVTLISFIILTVGNIFAIILLACKIMVSKIKSHALCVSMA